MKPTSRTSINVLVCFVGIAVAVPTEVSLLLAAPAASDTHEFLLDKEPEKAQQVKTIREKVKDGEEVVIVGRIGGRAIPWVKGAAAFSIVDTTLKSCDQIPGDNCPTPWDYCCETDLGKATVLVTFVDENGIVKKDLKKELKLEELQTVVVQGKAKRDAAGNVRILATKMFVRDDKPVVQ